MTHAGTRSARLHGSERRGHPRPRWSDRVPVRTSAPHGGLAAGRDAVAADDGRGERSDARLLWQPHVRLGSAEWRPGRAQELLLTEPERRHEELDLPLALALDRSGE